MRVAKAHVGQTAAYRLLGLKREPPPVYKGRFDPRVLFKAFLALHDVHAGALPDAGAGPMARFCRAALRG